MLINHFMSLKHFNIHLALHVGFTLPWIHYTSCNLVTSMELIHFMHPPHFNAIDSLHGKSSMELKHFMGSIHFNTPGALHVSPTLQ